MARLQANAREFPHRRFLVDAHHSLSYEETWQRALAVAAYFRSLNLRCARFHAPDSAAIVLGLLAADHIGASSCVLNALYSKSDLDSVLRQIGSGHLFSHQPSRFSDHSARDVAHLLRQRGDGFERHDRAHTLSDNGHGTASPGGSVTILTSGTTGAPKGVRYTWARLLRQVRHIDRTAPRVWLLTYGLSHFAGIQVLLHVLANGHTLIIPPSHHFEEIIAAVRRHRVDAISGTPTFWRLFAGHLSLHKDRAIPLKQITLGGEVCTADLLARLKQLFPAAAITQVYATTELGSCFVVRDGRPGFPAEFLERRVGNVRLKIIDGELYGKARNGMLGYAGSSTVEDESGWMASGDLVEVQGDRVLFRGRKSERINVGGVKVLPAKVEAIILQHKNVRAARVYGRPNPITGQLVVAELEVAAGVQHHRLLQELRAICSERLTRYEQPRQFTIVERIERRNGKIARRSR